MAEYYWHISERKERAYLCARPPGEFAPPDSPEQFAWHAWIGFVDNQGRVGLQCAQWPNWMTVAHLGRMPARARLDAAKTILLSLKEST
jgi:hypothetical protein